MLIRLPLLILVLAVLQPAGVQGQTAPAATIAPAIKSTPSAAGPNRQATPAVPQPNQSAPAAAPTGTQPAAESPRLQKLRALTFDRRPSAILAAWGQPLAKKETDAKPGAPKDQAASGAGAASAKGESKQTAAGEQSAGKGDQKSEAESAKADKEDNTAKKDDDGKKAPGKDANTSKEAEKENPPAKPAIPPEVIEKEMAAFQRMVTLGQWPEVKKYLAGLSAEEGKAGYEQMLNSLRSGPPPNQPMPNQSGPQRPFNPQFAQWDEKNVFLVGDVLGIAAAAPAKLESSQLTTISAILQLALAGNEIAENVIAAFKAELAKPEAELILTRRQLARLLIEGGLAVHAEPFLPTIEAAEKEKDLEGLNLLAVNILSRNEKEQKIAHLENAWRVTQILLAIHEGNEEERDKALLRAVDLAPKLRKELGQEWLNRSFTADPKRGMKILETIGKLTAGGLAGNPFNPAVREQLLALQKSSVEALLAAAPKELSQWTSALNLLAAAWIAEAEFSNEYDQSSSYSPRMQRDRWGNIYYMNYDYYQQPNNRLPQPVPAAKVLDFRPSEKWRSLVADSIKSRLNVATAKLFLKVNEADDAFPFIEGLATTHPEKAKELISEFLNVWTRNHDPNQASRYTSPYMYMYGFERRAESIPLTRSMQERNLEELSQWVARLRALNLGDLDQRQLSRAFLTCHSVAEVYRLEKIERVFGPLDKIEPDVLADLIQQMRANLSGLWTLPATQEKAQTKRKNKDIEAELHRGYELALDVVRRTIEKHSDSWRLALAETALEHDRINFEKELGNDANYALKRQEILKKFSAVAQKYAAKAPSLEKEKQSTEAYEIWFYASLGACDLGKIDESQTPDAKQWSLIKAAIGALPGELADWHRARFAGLLFSRMSGVKPHAKQAYLEGGFAIVGDDKQAYEARKVYEYYKDLVTEIKLEARIDGSPEVGASEPFGVFVNIRHTKEIERESGGFGRYLQNQNSNPYFSYNYGRPTADYRERFQDMVNKTLAENFQVLSITFQSEKVNSRATGELGWRYTPYAYILVKPNGPEVDRFPPLRLDLDFLDTSGYVVLPISSPAIPINCGTKKPAPRPVDNLAITQVLDERQAASGKLLLEVKARGRGLVGRLDDLLDVRFPGFDVARVDDNGLSVERYDEATTSDAVLSERLWTLELKAPSGETPKSFAFASAKVPTSQMDYLRYEDADLVAVTREFSLVQRYGGRSYFGIVAGVVGAVLLVAAGATAWLLSRRRKTDVDEGPTIPANLTPFSAIAFLRELRDRSSLTEEQRLQLAGEIEGITRLYFAENANGEPHPDLAALARRWAGTAANRKLP